MCEKARQKLAALISEHGEDSKEMQKMKIICDEFDNVDDKISSVSTEVGKVKKDVRELRSEIKANTQKTENVEERLLTVEKIALETQTTVNRVYDKMDKGNVEQDAAVMSFFRGLVGTKAGKVFLAFLFVFGGLACAYLVEHAEQIARFF